MTKCLRCVDTTAVERKSDSRPYIDGRPAYRVVFEQHHGIRLPRHVVLHHTCENPWCVNIEHLAPMTQRAHLKMHGITGGDANVGQALKTHCPAGHPYNKENTYRWRNERQCRICRLVAKRKFNARLKKEVSR